MRWKGWTSASVESKEDDSSVSLLMDKGENNSSPKKEDGIEIELGQREEIPLPPTEKTQIITNSGVYST
jgi:hypothetical protein